MFSLEVFGRGQIVGPEGPLTGRATQRHRLALLALLAVSGERGHSREKLLAQLWPECDTPRARHFLADTVYLIRQGLGDRAVLTRGDHVLLNPAVVRSDITEFEGALAQGHFARAAELYRGPLLDGFHLDDAPEFERWLDRERERLGGSYARALQALAEAAERDGDFPGAVESWERSAAHDPYDSHVVLRLMHALAASGNPAGALQYAARHARLLQEDLGILPATEVVTFAEGLRRESAAGRPGQGAAVSTPSVRAPERLDAGMPLQAEQGKSPAVRRPHFVLKFVVAALLVGVAIVGTQRLLVRAVQSEVSRSVSRHLGPRAGEVAPARPRDRSKNIAATELYRRGTDPGVFRSDSAARLGIEHLGQAIALDPTYAAAYAGLSRLYVRLGNFPDAETAAFKALSLDDSLAEAHAALGRFRMDTYDFAAAEAHLKRAVELDSTYLLALKDLSHLYLFAARPAEALAQAERAVRIDPQSTYANPELAHALLANARCDEALAVIDKLREVHPSLLRVAPIAAQCYAQKGMPSQAIAELRVAAEDRGPRGQALTGYILARAGQRTEALEILETLLPRWPHARGIEGGAFPVAIVYAGLGELDQTFIWLDRSLEDRSLYPLIMDPLFADLRRDPRFELLRQRLRL